MQFFDSVHRALGEGFRQRRCPRAASPRRTAAQLIAAIALLMLIGAQAQPLPRQAILLSVADAITPATMDYLQRGIADAEASDAAVVIIQLDTPGGLMASTRELIKTILASQVPVATYVAPSGARAASAGTYILLASHVAAMAPATHLGSATPVQMGGMPGLQDDREQSPGAQERNGGSDDEAAPRDSSAAMERKILEDAVSYIRELAARHDRNANWAERAVREAANLGAAEALESGVIDVVATDVADLLAQIHRQSIEMASGMLTLDTANAALVRVDPGWRTRLLSVISNPNIAYFLLLLGFYGIVFEFANPGSLFPGVIGATCLLLALFAFQILSVNYAGLALICLGLAFIIAEAFIPSFGVLGIGGIIGFVAGSVILMDGTNQSVSLPVVGGVGAIAAGFLLWTVNRLLALRRQSPVYGLEQLSSEQATASETFAADNGSYHGHVMLSGERWRATSDAPVNAGDNLRVRAVDGLTVHVTTETPANP